MALSRRAVEPAYGSRTLSLAKFNYKKNQAFAWLFVFGGEDGDRTHDLVIANDALSQLSYPPTGRCKFSAPGRPMPSRRV
jgi:hypothetical protein